MGETGLTEEDQRLRELLVGEQLRQKVIQLSHDVSDIQRRRFSEAPFPPHFHKHPIIFATTLVDEHDVFKQILNIGTTYIEIVGSHDVLPLTGLIDVEMKVVAVAQGNVSGTKGLAAFTGGVLLCDITWTDITLQDPIGGLWVPAEGIITEDVDVHARIKGASAIEDINLYKLVLWIRGNVQSV
ncbi:hypothetical protein LCGC14_0648030 [marine sediment metagenome]|uniref:Uncharacterized protein n=1 Tax=marine sediment metagenome TaxID=412755 RepID=A0A0F9QX64_9ZZZZ